MSEQPKYRCALCRGAISAADDLITVNVDGHAKAAHQHCPDAEPGRDWVVVEAREPDVGAPPISLDRGDRIRIVFEGTVDQIEHGFIGQVPLVSNHITTGVRLPHWLLRASHIERLQPADTAADEVGSTQSSPTHQALLAYIESRGIPMPVYTNGSKIIEEATELRDAVVAGDVQQVKEEVADVVITAAVAAHQFEFTVEEALAAKTAKDRGRGPKVIERTNG